MAHFAYTALQALSASIEVEKAEIMKHDIEHAIKSGVENGMPFAKAEILLPKEGGVDMLQGQIAALEADGFKVIVMSVRETWAELVIIWGNVTPEIEKELDSARSRIATKNFELMYEETKRQLKKDLWERSKHSFDKLECRTIDAAYAAIFSNCNWQKSLAKARDLA